MNKIWIIIIVLVLGTGTFLLFKNQTPSTQSIQPSATEKSTNLSELITPKKSAHYESNTPRAWV